MKPTYYLVEQGMVNPRDDTVGWRVWDQFATKPEAMKAARRLAISRVIEARVVMTRGESSALPTLQA